MNPKFDPANVSLVLKWTVIASDDGSETKLEVTNIGTEPASNPKAWHVSQFLAAHNITLVEGDYTLRCTVAGGLQVLSMPVEMGEDGRHAIIEAFGPNMAEQVEMMTRFFQYAPTDEQIVEGAKEIAAAALHSLLEPTVDGDDSKLLSTRAIAVKPGFIRVSESECSQCGGREIPRADPNQGIVGLLGAMANLLIGDSEATTIGFGAGSAFIEPNGTGVNVRVGFASHACPFALYFNGLLADAMRDAVAKAEALIIQKMVTELLPTMRREVSALENLAENFGVELPEADAAQSQA